MDVIAIRGYSLRAAGPDTAEGAGGRWPFVVIECTSRRLFALYGMSELADAAAGRPYRH